MTVGIGAGGFMGVALETTPGTYVAPTKFFPILDESLQFQQETIWRRPIRQSADIIGAVPGNAHVEGDISMEAFEDVIPYFMLCGRTAIIKTGATNYVYTITPTPVATPVKTMSITVIRNGETFGYTGCVVNNFTLTVVDGLLQFNVNILGLDEADQSLPTPTYTTTVPFGAGTYSIQIPTASQVFDCDGFEFKSEANANPEFRLKSSGRGAQFISFGENSTSLTTDRDFEDRDEYELFKSVTAQAITLLASKGANNSVQITMHVGVMDTYELGLSGQGDLIRAAITYMGVANSSGIAYTMVVKSQESITVT